ncbi:pentapeptide repeat-containing protein [Rhodovulum visakhapatnamense]|uniref:Pentapeptide repeat protein n=1 Tax=Rhodovulum visakhapatnamense TaxID=364297 RepID=A0A4R8F897_9RHOB|nr:pentapeptide repeat-containing protein [Rhodovulum visakhapatnamense]TDX18411.1 pentapeptide repeat protein [Rhodovulum visakhapatnamense]
MPCARAESLLSTRPSDIAKSDFFGDWCKREANDCTRKELSEYQQALFEREFRRRREAAISELRKPQWHQPGHQKPDFRGAQLTDTFLAGANLIGAQMEGADLSWVQMEGADLSMSFLTGVRFEPLIIQSANLRAVTNGGGALRFADLRSVNFNEETDFRNAFLDGSVQITDGFRKQMGDPCQWHADVLSDEEFFGRWRGWLEASGMDSRNWSNISPEGWSDVAAIPPPDGCNWKTGSISDTSQ